MDPIAQILAQQSSGSAEGQGFGADYARGQDFSLRERYLSLQQKADARAQKAFDDLEPLRVKEAQDNAAIAGATKVTELQRLGAIAKSNMVMPDIIQLQIEAASVPGGTTNPDWRQKVLKFSQSHPVEMSVGEGVKLWQMMRSGPMFEQQFNQIIEAEKKLKGTGILLQDFNSETGNFKLMREASVTANNPTTAMKNVQYQSFLKSQIEATPEGPAKAALQEQLKLFQEETAPRGFIVQTNPDGTTQIIQGTPGMLTGAQKGQQLEAASLANDATRRIEEIKGISDVIFGPKAAAGDIIVDRGLANVIPELLNKQRVRGREAAGYVKETIMRSLNKGQGSMSDKDVKRLENLYPALKGFEQIIESPARAKEVLGNLQQQLAQDAYRNLRLSGERPDIATLRYLPPKFLQEEYRDGRITLDELRQAFNSSPFDDQINDLIRQQQEKDRGGNK